MTTDHYVQTFTGRALALQMKAGSRDSRRKRHESSSSSSNSPSSLSAGAKAGIAIGVLIAVLLLLLALCCCLRRRIQRRSRFTGASPTIGSNKAIEPRHAEFDVEQHVSTGLQRPQLQNSASSPTWTADAGHKRLMQLESAETSGIAAPALQLAVQKEPMRNSEATERPITRPIAEERGSKEPGHRFTPSMRASIELIEQQLSTAPTVAAERRRSDVPIVVQAPQTKEEYTTYVGDFITKDVPQFFDPNEELVKTLAEKASEQADMITAEFELRPEITPQVVKLAFYDFVILCDDSSSMNWDKESIPALKDTLRRVARFATILDPKGISLRFLNYNEGSTGTFDGLISAEEVEKKFANVPFSGSTRLGEVLDEKILQPMILQKAAGRRLDKPLFVIVITDGMPSGEPPESLRNAILRCKKSLACQAYGSAAAVFLISRVGNSEEAKVFLQELEKDRDIGDMIFCSTEDLEKRLAASQQINDKRYTAWLIELCLAALDKQSRH